VQALARRIANIGHDLLVHNKRIVNLGGADRAESDAGARWNPDALAHQAPEALDFSERLREKGVRAAAAERDAKFEKR
jgi:hypothetical protein